MDMSPAAQPVPQQAQPTHRRWRRPLQVAAAVLVVLIGLYIYQYVTRGAFWRGTFERYVSARAGRPVKVAGPFELYLDPNLHFRADGLSIANPDWAEADRFLAARHIALDASIWQLIMGHVRIDDLELDGGRIALQRRADGSNTWTFGGDTKLEIPDISRAAITDSAVSLIDAATRTRIALTFGDIAGTAAGGRQRIAGPLTFAGSGTTHGAPFTLQGRLTTPNAAAAGGRLGLDLAARIAETRITLAGTLPGATRIDGADLKVTVAGRNLQTPGRLFGIVLPATRPYALGATMTKTGRDYNFRGITGHFGSSDLAGELRVTAPADAADKLRINGTLSSRVLDILDVGPFIGYSPERLEAQGGKGAITVEAGRPRILPDAPLAIEQLKNFDAHVDYTATTVRTGNVPIAGLKLGFYLENQVLDLDPLAFDLATGRLTSVVRINAAVAPVVTDYDIRLSQVPIGKLLTSFKIEDSGTTALMRARIQLQGRGDTVRKSLGTSSGRIALVFPAGTLWVRNIQLAKLDLQNFLTALIGKKLKEPRQFNCGVIAFTVKDGRAVADPILFDSKKSVFRGTGSFNFADESLALSLEGDSKEFSLLSGQSPIGINGWFAKPGINPVSGELVTRGLAAVALGVVATPIAAIAAFIDFGDAKDQDCTPILAARSASATTVKKPK